MIECNKKSKILIVDYDFTSRCILSEVLNKTNYEIKEASNGNHFYFSLSSFIVFIVLSITSIENCPVFSKKSFFYNLIVFEEFVNFIKSFFRPLRIQIF